MNLISLVSLFGITIGTTALILVLSVFNGFENLVLSMYNSFDPHLKITTKHGKLFNPKSITHYISENNEIKAFSFILEEKAMLKYGEKEFIATIKGVSSNYQEIVNFDSLLVDGNYIEEYQEKNVAIVGSGIAYHLSIGLQSIFEPLKVFIPNKRNAQPLAPQNAFNESSVTPVGMFSIQSEIDQEYVITPILFLRNLLNIEEEVSAIEIQLKDPKNMLMIQEQLKKILKDNYIIENRLEQQEFLYKLLNTEKLVIFLILVFIMIIASFNIIGSLTVLILDKKNDIQILKSFGTSQKGIQKIFFNTSMLNIFLGLFFGVLLGLTLALLQQKFGFIGMGSGSFIIDAYPVSFSLADIILISITVILIGILISWYPSRIITREFFKN